MISGDNGDTPAVSVCVPAYNEEEYLCKTIESVLNQTFHDYEMVVVDDGSTDGTADIIQAYAAEDERIKSVYQENAGVAVAQNTAIETASGEYYAILEADDLWEAEKLERHYRYMEKTGVAMTHSNAYNIDKTDTITGVHHDDPPPTQNDADTYLRELFMRNFVCTPTVVIRSSVVDDRPFDESYDQSHDHDLWLRIAADHDVGYIDAILAKKRYHSSNLSGNYENAFKMRKRFVEKAVNRYPELQPVADKKYASIYLTVGIHRIVNDDQEAGRRALRAALSHDLTLWKVYPAYALSYLSPSLLASLSKAQSAK